MNNDPGPDSEKVVFQTSVSENGGEIALEADIEKPCASPEKTVKMCAPVVPPMVVSETPDEVLDTVLGKSNSTLINTVDTLGPVTPSRESEVSEEKAQGPKRYTSRGGTLENLEKLLGKPYVYRNRRTFYAGETEEKRAKRLENARLRLALKKQSMSKEEREKFNKRTRILTKLRLAYEPQEKRAERLASKRLRSFNTSADIKAARCAKAHAKRILMRANETPEQRAERSRKERLKRQKLSAAQKEFIKKRAKERRNNLSEAEKEDLRVRRRAENARRRCLAQERQKMKGDEHKVKQQRVKKQKGDVQINLPQLQHSGPAKYFLLSEVTVEPDVPDYSFYNYVYNEIQPLMIHFNENQQFFRERPRKY